MPATKQKTAFGAILAAELVAKGESVRGFALRSDFPPRTVADWIEGKTSPSIDNAAKALAALGRSLSWYEKQGRS